jgi:hypothetical protein
MHDGKEKRLDGIIFKYNRAAFGAGVDPLVQPLGLTDRDRNDLLAFLRSISSPPLPFQRPGLPE